MKNPWWWSVLAVVAVLFFVGSLVNALYNFSVLSLLGFALNALITFWAVGGSARRGEPLAKWLLRWKLRMTRPRSGV